MATAVLTWIISVGVGAVLIGSWLRAGGKRPQARKVSDYPPLVVAGHLFLAVSGIALWVPFVVTDSGLGPWLGFADLVIFACIGDDLLLQWAHSWRASPARVIAQRVLSGFRLSADRTGHQIDG